MVVDKATSHGLEWDSKVHGNVRWVRTNKDIDVEDEEWHRVKYKIEGKGVAIQRDTKSTNGEAISIDKSRMDEGFKKNPW